MLYWGLMASGNIRPLGHFNSLDEAEEYTEKKVLLVLYIFTSHDFERWTRVFKAGYKEPKDES